MCRKRRHKRQQDAVAAMISMYRRQMADRGTLNTYHCPDCRAWHVGHKKYTERIPASVWDAIKTERITDEQD